MEGIVIEGLHKVYPLSGKRFLPVIQDVHMAVSLSEIVALTGASGSGKSTIAKLIMGLEYPSKGSITIDGIDYRKAKKLEKRNLYRRVQGVFQDAGGTLNPRLSVYHNIEESLVNLTSLNKAQRRERLLTLMAQLDLSEKLLKQHVHQLSGGEQRRLSLLRALSVQPKYLLLDEVVSGLDQGSIQRVERLLTTYRKRYNCSYLYITHHWESACRLSDRILIMDKGRIVKEGTNIDNDVDNREIKSNIGG